MFFSLPTTDPESYHLMPVWIELAGVPSAIVYVQDETCEKAKTKAEEGKGKQKRDKYKIRKQIHNSNNKIN